MMMMAVVMMMVVMVVVVMMVVVVVVMVVVVVFTEVYKLFKVANKLVSDGCPQSPAAADTYVIILRGPQWCCFFYLTHPPSHIKGVCISFQQIYTLLINSGWLCILVFSFMFVL